MTKAILPIISYPSKQEEFNSSGISRRPPDCTSCKMNFLTTGFVPDKVPKNPKLAFLLMSPYSDDAVERIPLAGNMGYVIRGLCAECGVDYDKDVLVSHAMRCFVPMKSQARDPNGKIKRLYLEAGAYNCRAYDYFHGNEKRELVPKGIVDWRPTHYICTFEFKKLFEQPAYKILMKADISKALRVSSASCRPVVVFGGELAKLVMPWVNEGGLKMWRGSLDEWQWRPGLSLEPEKTNGMFKRPKR